MEKERERHFSYPFSIHSSQAAFELVISFWLVKSDHIGFLNFRCKMKGVGKTKMDLLQTPEPFRSQLLLRHGVIAVLRLVAPLRVQRMERGECPLCGALVREAEFRSEAELEEFHRTACCQACVDRDGPPRRPE